MDTGSTSATSPGLLRRLSEGQPEAWDRLVHLTTPLVLRWCRALGIGDQDAADVAQEVYRAVLLHAGRIHLNDPGDSFRGWLRTVTRSKVHDLWRRRSTEAEAEGGSTHQSRLSALPAPPESAAQPQEAPDERHLLVHQALDLLRPSFEPRTWRAFWRTAVDGAAAADVAAELGMSAGAVRVAKSRILNRLRAELEGFH